MFSVHPRYTCWGINANGDISYSLLVHHLYIGTILLHTGREPTIRGWKKGSGTVWVSLFTYQNIKYNYIQYIKYLLKQPISIFGGKLAPKSHTCFPSETKFFWVQLCPLQWPFDITWSHINIYHHVELFDFIILFVLFVHIYATWLQLCKIFIDCSH